MGWLSVMDGQPFCIGWFRWNKNQEFRDQQAVPGCWSL